MKEIVKLPSSDFERVPDLDVIYNDQRGYGYSYKDIVKFVLWVNDHISVKFVLSEQIKEVMDHEERRTYYRYINLTWDNLNLTKNEINKLLDLCEYLYKKETDK